MSTTSAMASTPAPAPSTQQTAKTETTSFLDLPAEIRNRIYQLALTRSRTLNICKPKTSKMRLNNTRIFPSIIRTCRQIHREATPILYGDNSFSLGGYQFLSDFLTAIGTSVKHLRRIEVEDEFSGKNVVSVLYATSLDKFIIHWSRRLGGYVWKRITYVDDGRKDDELLKQLKDLVEIKGYSSEQHQKLWESLKKPRSRVLLQ